MSDPPANLNRTSVPAGESEEQLLDDLAAGHVGELSRRSAETRPSGPVQPPPPAEGPPTDDEAPAPEPTPDSEPERDSAPNAESEYNDGSEPSAEAETGCKEEHIHASEALADDDQEQDDEAVDELLAAVERAAGRQPPQRPRPNALFGATRTRRRFSLPPDLSPRIRAIAPQAAAVAAGAAGTAILAWLMFG